MILGSDYKLTNHIPHQSLKRFTFRVKSSVSIFSFNLGLSLIVNYVYKKIKSSQVVYVENIV